MSVTATFTLPDPSGDTANGVFTLAGGTQPALIATDGTPDFARAYDDADPAVYPLAKRSLRAHLDKLVAEGRARQASGRYILTADQERSAP